ncbi:IS630 family transposase [Rhizophagus irregularis DAOM 181602=DAOM 197198]|nr:IS630 family transposase [Rhizophagus irregularis DAOM 181602=DAOM 197198]
MKPLTPKTRYAIIYGYNCGQSGRLIAEHLGCSRPPLFDSPARQELKAFVKENGENRRLCSKKLATVWTARKKQPISVCTIRRNLKKVGLSACIPRHKPAMTEAHRQARLEWALAHRDWTTRKWRRVLFSDESTFTQFQKGRQGRVWREPGEELNPDCIAVTVKHSPSRMLSYRVMEFFKKTMLHHIVQKEHNIIKN